MVVYSVRCEAWEDFLDGTMYFPTLKEARDAYIGAKYGKFEGAVYSVTLERVKISGRFTGRDLACRLLNHEAWQQSSTVLYQHEPP